MPQVMKQWLCRYQACKNLCPIEDQLVPSNTKKCNRNKIVGNKDITKIIYVSDNNASKSQRETKEVRKDGTSLGPGGAGSEPRRRALRLCRGEYSRGEP